MSASFDLIVTIVNRGVSESILKASKEAGAEGGTVLFGRGSGIHETKTMFGIPIEPEKEIVLTVVPGAMTDKVLEAVVGAGDLDQAGSGIAFVVALKRVAGICHLFKGILTCD
ncbi:MAG: P-II family nitrogen regulator [Candidatus Aminicenantes bacterium]|nr:P-II family nitrogen regulator [Candidatus Aminicenantes bacterium]